MIKTKLIIWDYDGVLSDSEKLWIKIWQDLINEKFALGWDFETADKSALNLTMIFGKKSKDAKKSKLNTT